MTIETKVNYRELAAQVLEGYVLTEQEALAIVQAPDEDLPAST